MNKIEVKPSAMRESRDIEWLVNWTLEKQGLGRDLVMREAAGRSRDIPTGMRVDGGGGGGDGRWTHVDAQIISRQINVMAADQRTAAATAMMVHYGRIGMRPDWGSDGSGSWQPVRKGNGKIVRRYRDPNQWRGIIGFEWEWVGHRVEDLDRLMLEYMAWHAALCDLRVLVNPQLTTYLATAPAAPEAPWDDPQRMVHYPDGRSVEA